MLCLGCGQCHQNVYLLVWRTSESLNLPRTLVSSKLDIGNPFLIFQYFFWHDMSHIYTRKSKYHCVLFFSGEGDNIRVYVRVRPPDKHLETDLDSTPCLEVTSGNTVVLQSKPDPKNFSFDHVADINATQVGFNLKCANCC